MRNGAACPSSGGSTIGGNSGANVCVEVDDVDRASRELTRETGERGAAHSARLPTEAPPQT